MWIFHAFLCVPSKSISESELWYNEIKICCFYLGREFILKLAKIFFFFFFIIHILTIGNFHELSETHNPHKPSSNYLIMGIKNPDGNTGVKKSNTIHRTDFILLFCISYLTLYKLAIWSLIRWFLISYIPVLKRKLNLIPYFYQSRMNSLSYL